MHPRVRALYKEFMLLGPQLPPSLPMHRYRDVVKNHFRRVYNAPSTTAAASSPASPSSSSAHDDASHDDALTPFSENRSPLISTTTLKTQNDDHHLQNTEGTTSPSSEPHRGTVRTDTSDALKKSLAWGRYRLREVQTVIHVHKFRHLKKHYDSDSGVGWSSFSAGGNEEIGLMWKNEEARRQSLIEVRTAAPPPSA